MFQAMKTISLAIIIPTLNEEYFIGDLLDSIAKQTVWPKEIVVVDAYSPDNTISEIKKRQKSLPQLKFYQIPRSTISKQRNLGVSKTRSEHILFLDADMELKQKDTLERYYNEVLEKKPDCAAAINLPNSNYWKDNIFFKLENLLFKVSQSIWLIVTARNLYIKRELFNKIGGFDEQVAVAEDQELVHRVIKKRGKFTFLEDSSIYTSTRRVEKEGRRKYFLKMAKFGFKIAMLGHRKSNIKYEFGNFKRLNQ